MGRLWGEMVDHYIKLVIFDLDQTLIDTRDRNNDAVTIFMKGLGLADPVLRAYILSHSARYVAEELSQHLEKEITAEQVEEEYVEAYHASREPIFVPKESIPIIRLLREKSIAVAAVTSASAPIVYYNLCALQVASLSQVCGDTKVFDAVVAAEPGLPHKPDCAVLTVLEARLQRSFRGESILVVGDSVDTDGQLAMNIGAYFQGIGEKYTLAEFYNDLQK